VTTPHKQDVHELIMAVLDGSPSDQQHTEFVRLMKTDSDAREIYARQAAVNALLERLWVFFDIDADGTYAVSGTQRTATIGYSIGALTFDSAVVSASPGKVR